MATAERDCIPDFDFDRSSLLLDIDGTLLDIAQTSDGVVVPDGLVAQIARISQRTSGAVAFVSGRQISAIDALFAPLRLPAIGCHGVEFRAKPNDAMDAGPTITREVKRPVAAIAETLPGVRIEDKGHSLAIHFRSVPEAEPAVRRALSLLRPALSAAGLELLEGKAVIEVKPRGFDKGTGFSRLMTVPPFSARRPVFLGDDTTDEDVFRILPRHEGTGYAVSRRIGGAVYTFPSPADVRRWLECLAAN